MKAVLQRVKGVSVTVEGTLIGNIERGLLVYLGVEKGDDSADMSYIADKVRFLRIFADDRGRVLVVSQFTLLADCRKGRRPGFS